MEKREIFVNTITQHTISNLEELINNNVKRIKSREIDDFINKFISDFYIDSDISPEDIKESQEKENIKFYDLIKSNVFEFLINNKYKFYTDNNSFVRR